MADTPLPSAEELLFAYRREKAARKQSELILQTKTREIYRVNEQLSRINIELQEHQQAIIQKEKLAGLGTLVAGVAHEINNPLAFVIGNVQNLKNYVDVFIFIMRSVENMEGLDKAALQDIYSRSVANYAWLDVDGIIADSADIFSETFDGLKRVKSIVTNLKNFARKDDTGLATYNLGLSIESALMILAGEINGKCTLNLDVGTVANMVFNPNMMVQIIINLVTNALHSLVKDRPGVIAIRCWQEGRYEKIRIEDNGCGMSESVMNNIFVPFFTTKPSGQGTGLGLAICYEKVKEMGGVIEVESTLGQGSIFTLIFDLDASQVNFCKVN